MNRIGVFFKKEVSCGGWLDYIYLTIAGLINSVGVTMFLYPSDLLDGGLSGLSILLGKVTPISMSVFLIVLNLPFFVFGFKRMGARFVMRSLYAILVYSLFSLLWQSLPNLDLTVSPIAFRVVEGVKENDPLLCCVFGGLLSGIGSGLTIRLGGALDGVEVMAVSFAKYLGMTVGSFVMVYNAIMYCVAGLIFGNWAVALYSVIAYAVGLKAVDFVVEGLDKAKSATIVTEKGDEMARELSEALGRGITIMDGKGFYSGQARKVVLCVVNRFQIGKLKNIVHKIDQGAFVTISEVSDTLGTSVKLSRAERIRKLRARKSDSKSGATSVEEKILEEPTPEPSVAPSESTPLPKEEAEVLRESD